MKILRLLPLCALGVVTLQAEPPGPPPGPHGPRGPRPGVGPIEGAIMREAWKEKDLPPSLRTPIANARVEFIRRAILRGLEKGDLTQAEANALERELEKVKKLAERYKSNDVLTGKEHVRLHEAIEKLADEVHKQCNDSDRGEPKSLPPSFAVPPGAEPAPAPDAQ